MASELSRGAIGALHIGLFFTMEVPRCQLVQLDIRRELRRYFAGSNSWCWLGDGGMLLDAADGAEDICRLVARRSDVWIVGFPGSDAGLVQELVWLICGGANWETAGRVRLVERYGSYGMRLEGNGERGIREVYANYKLIDGMTSPRFIKTHIPLYLRHDLLNIGCKIIYVARNVKDVVTTAYEFGVGFSGGISTYWNFLQNDLLPYCPYWEHVKSAWRLRHHSNLLFLFYEEVQVDIRKTIRKTADFLGRRLSDDQVQDLAGHVDNLNYGIVKNPTNVLTNQVILEIDDWTVENCRGTDITFPPT